MEYIVARNVIEQATALPRVVADWLVAGMEQSSKDSIAKMHPDGDRREVLQIVAAELRRRADGFAK